jgi:predicted DNA-binding WGR domain protein
MTIPSVHVFTRVRPEEDEHRWYSIVVGPTLLGTWGVVLAWGRLGANRYRQRVLEFPTAGEAVAEARAQIERRLSRGYIRRRSGFE